MIQFYSSANIYTPRGTHLIFSCTFAVENRAPWIRILSCGNRSFPTFSEFVSFASDYPILRYTEIRFIVAELDDAPAHPSIPPAALPVHIMTSMPENASMKHEAGKYSKKRSHSRCASRTCKCNIFVPQL